MRLEGAVRTQRVGRLGRVSLVGGQPRASLESSERSFRAELAEGVEVRDPPARLAPVLREEVDRRARDLRGQGQESLDGIPDTSNRCEGEVLGDPPLRPLRGPIPDAPRLIILLEAQSPRQDVFLARSALLLAERVDAVLVPVLEIDELLMLEQSFGIQSVTLRVADGLDGLASGVDETADRVLRGVLDDLADTESRDGTQWLRDGGGGVLRLGTRCIRGFAASGTDSQLRETVHGRCPVPSLTATPRRVRTPLQDLAGLHPATPGIRTDLVSQVPSTDEIRHKTGLVEGLQRSSVIGIGLDEPRIRGLARVDEPLITEERATFIESGLAEARIRSLPRVDEPVIIEVRATVIEQTLIERRLHLRVGDLLLLLGVELTTHARLLL